MPVDIYRVTVTGQGIVKRALRKVGVIAAGETMTADEQADGIEALNHMLDSWNTEKLNVYQYVRSTAALTAGQQTRTIGSGGNLDMLRPQTIEKGQAFITGASLGSEEYELDVYTHQEWGRLGNKSASGRPSGIYYEPAVQRGILYFDPIPDAAYTLILFLRNLLAQVTVPTDPILLPPGMTESIICNLAIQIAPEYLRNAPPEVIQQAIAAKANMKRENTQPLLLETDIALRGGGVYDINSGGMV